MADLFEHEKLFFEQFVDKSQKARLLALSQLNSRKKLLSYLPHKIRFDNNCVFAIPPNKHSSKHLTEILLSHGCPEKVYLISEVDELDLLTLTIEDAMNAVVGSGFASIVSCVPGKLAYYEGEEIGNRLLLKKP